jgi:hypothetical protein
MQEFKNSSRENDPIPMGNKNKRTTNSTTSTEKLSSPPALLLIVPFYVYEELDWLKATFGGISVLRVCDIPVRSPKSIKHLNDYSFLMDHVNQGSKPSLNLDNSSMPEESQKTLRNRDSNKGTNQCSKILKIVR